MYGQKNIILIYCDVQSAEHYTDILWCTVRRTLYWYTLTHGQQNIKSYAHQFSVKKASRSQYSLPRPNKTNSLVFRLGPPTRGNLPTAPFCSFHLIQQKHSSSFEQARLPSQKHQLTCCWESLRSFYILPPKNPLQHFKYDHIQIHPSQIIIKW
jgi:hypothetical protein